MPATPAPSLTTPSDFSDFKDQTMLHNTLRPTLLRLLACLMCASVAHAAPTGLLNDTGGTQCDDGSNTMVTCTMPNTGDAAMMPRQDGRFGRDAASPTKVGGGVAGFDFTKICMDGTLNCTGAANIGVSPAATDWACTRDNVTNLVWSLYIAQPPTTWATATGASYPNAGHNTVSRCGFNTGWRLPTRRELLSLVYYGAAAEPFMDTHDFPKVPFGSTGNLIDHIWTSDAYAGSSCSDCAWYVHFGDGRPVTEIKTAGTDMGVRLVRDGP